MNLSLGRAARLLLLAGAALHASSAAFAQSAPAATPATKTVRLDLSGAPPLAPSRGTIRAFPISSPNHFLPGQLVDGYFGDYVLENDAVRFVIANPEKNAGPGVSRGSIIDISRQSRPLDYINSIQTIGDLETTAGLVNYTYADEPKVEQGATATVVLHGTSSIPQLDDEKQFYQLDVTTTYTLTKNSNVLAVETQFTNPSTTETALLQPGDVVDWGEATGFVEGVGIGNTTATANFVIGFASDYSVGIVNAGSEPIHGVYTSRDAVIPPYAHEDTSSALQNRTAPTRAPSMDSAAGPKHETKSQLQLAVEQAREDIRRGKLPVRAPGTETQYGNTTATLLQELQTSEILLQAQEAEQAEKAAKIAAEEQREELRRRKLRLDPGKSYSFTRYVVVSDNDFSRITDFAFTQKNIPTGYLAGAVLEAGTDAPVADADVYISGGPRWNGNITAPAYLKTRTRADGTFACRVPAGKYVLSSGKIGRVSLTPQSVITVTAGSRPQITALAMSPESRLRVAVSEAETATSSPLPCRLTFVSKQGTPTIDWGDAPLGERGIRNEYFLPYGAENILLTPGRYQVYVSRGVEYDSLVADVDLAPGTNQTLKVSLPHTLHGILPNSFSMDAGIMTTASACAAAAAEDRVVQAACEGVHVIVSGDYNKATDLQPTIDRLGLGKWVKALVGMRLLLHKGTESAEVLAYPLSKDQATSLTAFLPQLHDLPPDVALADLRKAFPNVLLELMKPSDPERGYLANIKFDEARHVFVDENVPPPDFDSMQIFEGKKLGLEQINYPRYSDLQIRRSLDTSAKVPPISPTAFSNSSLPFGQEIGYPRMYLHTDKSDFHQVDEAEVIKRIRGQRYMVTNGPILSLSAQELPSGEYRKHPGDVIDLSTTKTLRMQMKVYAASWVSVSGVSIHEDGLIQWSTPQIRILSGILRYPVMAGPEIIVRYVSRDSFMDGLTFGQHRDLSPIVPNALPDFGGAVHPYAFTAPLFVDKEGDGQLRLSNPLTLPPPDQSENETAPPQ